MRKVKLNTLQPGARFVCCGQHGKLLRLGPGSAHVEIHEMRTRSFTTKDGESVTLGTNRVRTTWSLETEVEVVDVTEVNGHILIGPVAS